MNYFVIAGIFSLFPAPVIKTFGPRYGPQVYTLILAGGFGASIWNLINIKVLYNIIGEGPVLAISGVFSLLAMGTLFFFKEGLDIEKLQKKGFITWTKYKVDVDTENEKTIE